MYKAAKLFSLEARRAAAENGPYIPRGWRHSHRGKDGRCVVGCMAYHDDKCTREFPIPEDVFPPMSFNDWGEWREATAALERLMRANDEGLLAEEDALRRALGVK